MANSDSESKLLLFDKLVDILTDLYDPPVEELEETRDDMMQVVSLIFESLSLDVKESSDKEITFSVAL